MNSKDAHWLKDSLRGAGEILRVTAIAGIVAIAELRWPDDRSRTEKLADYILASTRALGPLYVKMAQILAAQSGVISEGFRRRLQTTFDRNPAIPHARIEKAIEQSYGEPLGARFATFDACPIGVGTIAQVHRATLVTGENVAVKVVKPGAGRSLRTALIAVSLLIGLADVFMPRARPLRLRQNFRDLRKVVEAQTDMRLELQNQLAVARSFDGHPFVRVPRTFASHCNVSVLVMEFVEGVKGYEVDRIEIDRTLLARRLQDTFYTMIYLHGRFHVDPHPGNLLLNSDGKLVLLDFGLFGTLSEELKWDLSGFYYACVHKNWESATTRFVRCFVDEDVSRLKNDEEFKVKLCSILRVHFEERTNRWSTVGFIRDTHSLLYARSLRMKSGMPLLILCLLTGEGLLHDVDSRVDIWANARHFVDRASPHVSESVRLRLDRAIGRTLPKSIEARRAARDVLVAPTHLDRFVLPSEYPLVVKKAQGAWLEDIDGHRYVDLSGGYGPHLLGYGHHVIVDALVETLRSKWVNALATEEEILLAQTIAAAFPGNNRVIFSNSGTEAILIAIRLCRAFTGRQKVAKFEGHFHGHSDQGLVSAWFRFAGTEQCPEPIAGTLGTASSIVASTIVLQYGHSDGLDVIYKQRKELACVICEPMPAILCDYDVKFLSRLGEVCRDAGIPLIFDEVVSGFRVAYGGVQTLLGQAPDVTCLGKIIGGGLPCGAVVGRAEIIEIARSTNDPFRDIDERAFAGGTFSGNAATCSAGLAMLTYLGQNKHLYKTLECATTQLKTEMIRIAREQYVPFLVSAMTGIMALRFSSAPVSSPRQQLTGSNFKANLALSYYMRERGVYLPELHTIMLSIAHGDTELAVVSDAFRAALISMRAEGFFQV